MVGLVVAAALSGCAAEKAATQSSASFVPQTSATVTDETGGLNGMLVDDEMVPIPNATVGIRSVDGSRQNQTTSSPDGEFSFSDLSPGEYELAAQSPFHEPATRKASVFAGEVAEVQFVLRTVAGFAGPLVEITPKKGMVACSLGWTTGNYQTMNACYQQQGDASDFKLPLNLNLSFFEVVLELAWQPGTGFSGSSLRMDLCSEKPDENNRISQCKLVSGSNPYTRSVAGPPPLLFRTAELPLETVKAYEVAIGDAGVNASNPRVPITFQQSFDLYMSVCYNANCTVDFSARPPS